jgi:hypothetical protein
MSFFCNQIINLGLSQEYNLILRFSLEILLNGLVYYLFFGALSLRLVDVHILLNFIKLSSVLLLPFIFIQFSELDSVRRIGTHDSYLPVAIDHMGHALAISCMISLYCSDDEYRKKRYLRFILNIFLSIFLLFAAILSGSKAAILSLILFGCLWFVTHLIYFVKHAHIAILCLLLLCSFLFVVGGDTDFSPLIERFEVESIWRGLQQRIFTFNNSWQASSGGIGILLGESWRYDLINSIDPIPYPHNFFLSILLHSGLMPLIFFSIFIVNRLFVYFGRIWKSSDKELWTLFNGMVYGVLIYVLTSGRITRVITIFVVFAIIEGYSFRNRDKATSAL